jgi:hypothetical protein
VHLRTLGLPSACFGWKNTPKPEKLLKTVKNVDIFRKYRIVVGAGSDGKNVDKLNTQPELQ